MTEGLYDYFGDYWNCTYFCRVVSMVFADYAKRVKNSRDKSGTKKGKGNFSLLQRGFFIKVLSFVLWDDGLFL